MMRLEPLEHNLLDERGRKIGTYRYANVQNIYENLACKKEEQFEICKKMLDNALKSKYLSQEEPIDTIEFFNNPYKKEILKFKNNDWVISAVILDKEKIEKDSNQLREDFLNSDFGISYHKKDGNKPLNQFLCIKLFLLQRIKNLFK